MGKSALFTKIAICPANRHSIQNRIFLYMRKLLKTEVKPSEGTLKEESVSKGLKENTHHTVHVGGGHSEECQNSDQPLDESVESAVKPPKRAIRDLMLT